MSARQAFVPQRSQSRANTDTLADGQTNNLPGDAYSTIAMNMKGPQPSLDTEKPTETTSNGDRKLLSLDGLLGRRKGSNSVAARANPQGPERMQTPRRSFDGICRPEITPLSIIPYPTSQANTFNNSHMQQSMQPPRKSMPQSAFAFQPPSAPFSASRGMENGLGRGGERDRNDKGEQKGLMFFGGGDTESSLDTGGSVSGYMRVFSRSGSRGPDAMPSANERTPGTKIATPLPGYSHTAMAVDMETEDAAEEVYGSRSRSLEGIPEEADQHVVIGGGDTIRTLRRVKHGLDREEVTHEEDNIGGIERRGHWSAKRTRHDLEEEYTRLSSPRMPPTPAPPPPVETNDSSLTLESLFEHVSDFVTEEDFQHMCKHWRECTREEWLKGAEELTGELTAILNMVKDHLTEQVMSYANLANVVGERRADLDRCSETLQGGMNNIKENLTKLATRK